MDRGRRTALRAVVLGVDVVLTFVAMGCAFGGHMALRDVVPLLRAPPAIGEYAAVATLAAPLWLAAVVQSGLHRVFERPWSRLELVVALARMHVVGLVGLGLVLFVTQSTLNRSIVALFLLASFVLFYAERSIVAAWTRHQRKTGLGTTRLLVAGASGPLVDRFLRHVALEELPPVVVGRLGPPAEGDTAPLLGAIEELSDTLSREAIDEVVFFPPYDDPSRARDALETCMTLGTPASFALDTRPLGGLSPQVRRAYEETFLTFEVAARPPGELALKHAFDAVAAAVLLVLVSPILLAAIVGILVTMGRPIFFVQRRAGLRGREFPMVKLRTMVRDAEARRAALEDRNEMSGPVFKIADDPRVTALGRFLRASSIDELPQLWNVLTGSMSLVGPRPLPVAEQQRIVSWHRRRLSMKPGITCLWQVSGRSNVDFEDWMALDLRYVDEWSLWLDLKILILTIPAVLRGRGAR